MTSIRDLYKKILGEKNSAYYLMKFEHFDALGGLRPSWNWPAFFVGGLWALHRKMYGWSAVMVVAFLWYSVMQGTLPIDWGMDLRQYIMLREITERGYFIIVIVFAVFANSLYHRHIKRKVLAAQLRVSGDENQLHTYLQTVGGVNRWAPWIVATLPVVGIILAILIPKIEQLRLGATGNRDDRPVIDERASQFPSAQEDRIIASVPGPEATTAGQQNLFLKVSNNQIQVFPKSKVWGKVSFDDVILDLNYKTKVKPTTLVVGRDHPNGTKVLALFPGYGVHLPLMFPDEFGGFNDFGDINEGYYVQVAEHDFDNDGTPEILVAVGDGLVDLVVNVVKYHAPLSPADAGREENWELVGSFSGQEKAFINGDTVLLPIGSQGLHAEYTWSKTKFIQTNG